ncbi:MAG: S41 family peptidase [Patescibacteria group bacterium]
MRNFFNQKHLNIILALIIAVALGYWVGENFPQTSYVPVSQVAQGLSSNGVNSNLFNNVWDLIHTQYFYPNVSNSSLDYGAISGMVSSLGDPHTVFYNPTQAQLYYKAISGNSFAGIGVSLGYNKNGKVTIEQVLPNTPAKKAGIAVGDTIVSINGKTSGVSNINNVVSIVRGKQGTPITLSLKTDTGNVVTYKLDRESVHVSSIYIKQLQNGIVDVEILRFSDNSLTQWENNFKQKMAQVIAMNPKGIVLDLRGNPGGFFEAAIYAAGEFLPANTLVAKQQNRNGTYNEFYTSYQGNLQSTPMVILVNGGTASAAEILTGALQYYHRATVVGENTYGKGTAQNVFSFTNGSLLIMTTEHWLLPNGRWITPKHPIIPNIKIGLSSKDFSKGIDTQLNKAISLL